MGFIGGLRKMRGITAAFEIRCSRYNIKIIALANRPSLGGPPNLTVDLYFRIF